MSHPSGHDSALPLPRHEGRPSGGRRPSGSEPAHLTFAALAELLCSTPRRAGVPATRILLIDGRSGAGKSTLVARLLPHLLGHEPGALALQADDYVPGWHGLRHGIRQLSADIIEPLSEGRPARVRRYDWEQDAPGAWVDIPVAPLIVIEGSGVGAADARGRAHALVWVDASAKDRTARLDQRDDASAYGPFRSVWAAQERALVTTRRADRAAHLAVARVTPEGALVEVRRPIGLPRIPVEAAR